MTKDLATISNDSELNAVLHGIAQGGEKQELIPLIKFDATNGLFAISTGEKDDDNFPVYDEIGEKLAFHMVTSRRQYLQKNSSGIYSREFSGKIAELLNADKNVIFTGSMTDVKNNYGDAVRFCNNLYGLAKLDDEKASMAKLRITGSMCGPWFDIMAKFDRENPISRHVLQFERGVRMKGHEGSNATIATEAEINKYQEELKAGRKPKDNLFYMITIKPIIKMENEQVIQNVQMVIDYLKNKEENTEKLNVQMVIDYLKNKEENTEKLDEKVEVMEAEIVNERRTVKPETQKFAGVPDDVKDVFPDSEVVDEVDLKF